MARILAVDDEQALSLIHISDPARQTFITGTNSPSAEGGTAFFSPHFPPLFLFARILAI